MSTAQPNLVRELPCPMCGYDLRATPAGAEGMRCPECGAVTRPVHASRIPWLHRKERGRVRAYFQTIWMVLRHPAKLATEAHLNLPRRDAVMFHRVSVLLGTVIGAGLLMAAFAMRGDQVTYDLSAPAPAHAGSLPIHARLDMPLFALTDNFWVALPLVTSLWLWLVFSTATYRRLMDRGAGSRAQKNCVRQLLLYASGLVPVEMLFLGLCGVTGALLYGMDEGEREWLRGAPEQTLRVARIVLPLVMAAVWLIPTIVIIAWTGRAKAFRVALMTVVHPLCVAAGAVVTGAVVFWVIGYAAIAIYSMAH